VTRAVRYHERAKKKVSKLNRKKKRKKKKKKPYRVKGRSGQTFHLLK